MGRSGEDNETESALRPAWKFSGRRGTPIDLRTQQPGSLPPEVRRTLQRIAAERQRVSERRALRAQEGAGTAPAPPLVATQASSSAHAPAISPAPGLPAAPILAQPEQVAAAPLPVAAAPVPVERRSSEIAAPVTVTPALQPPAATMPGPPPAVTPQTSPMTSPTPISTASSASDSPQLESLQPPKGSTPMAADNNTPPESQSPQPLSKADRKKRAKARMKAEKQAKKSGTTPGATSQPAPDAYGAPAATPVSPPESGKKRRWFGRKHQQDDAVAQAPAAETAPDLHVADGIEAPPVVDTNTSAAPTSPFVSSTFPGHTPTEDAAPPTSIQTSPDAISPTSTSPEAVPEPPVDGAAAEPNLHASDAADEHGMSPPIAADLQDDGPGDSSNESAPTDVAREVEIPSSIAPVPAAPAAEEPVTDAPAAEAPIVDDATVEAPEVESPRKDPSPAEASLAAPPRIEPVAVERAVIEPEVVADHAEQSVATEEAEALPEPTPAAEAEAEAPPAPAELPRSTHSIDDRERTALREREAEIRARIQGRIKNMSDLFDLDDDTP